ncbi:H/ACA ribonucleoprotein complex non-core subunit NAF1 isoform X2 [Strix aluco]|uniref:H/ACA ribonucleoprotein complex non-core subunit NAF1 isoform X2 n=1 Tax=Strix aluco TaxID=111821 RepID=UPI003DA2C5DA
MEAQLAVVAQLQSLAFEPGTAGPPPPLTGGERTASTGGAPSPPSSREGAEEEKAPPLPAEGARSSPPPPSPSRPPAAAPSSDSDSDTDSDSSSTTSSSSRSPSTVSDEDDHPNEKDNRTYCVKTKDELPIDELPPVEDLSIILPDDVELKLFGTVSSIIEQLVIIESLRGLPPVNEESIIFKEDRQAAGKVFEIFGPVLHPFYVLRFNSSEHIKAKGINVQDSMYFAPSVEDFTQYIFAEKLKQEKGSDASWKNDQEPPPESSKFSQTMLSVRSDCKWPSFLRETSSHKRSFENQKCCIELDCGPWISVMMKKKERQNRRKRSLKVKEGRNSNQKQMYQVRIRDFISQCSTLLQVIQGDTVAEGSPGIHFLLHQALQVF